MSADLVDAPTFIRTAAEIDAAWVTRALQPRFPGVEALTAQQSGHIRGAQTKVRLALTWNQRGRDLGLPERLIVKADIEEFGRGPVAAVRFNEPRTYRDIVPTLEVEAPRVFATETGESGPAFTIMEDLTARDVAFLNLGDPISPELAARFLASLARIHARWWDSPELSDQGRFGALRKPMIGMFETYVRSHLSPEGFAQFALLPRAAATPKLLRDPERLLRGLLRLRDLHREMPVCIIHGDTHLNNLYVAGSGQPGFYDWSPRRTAWSNEIAYFLPAALDVPDRRRVERDLLAHYLSCLAAQGVAAPSFEDAWLAYRRELIWGMFVFLINGPTQTEFANTAAAARFATAMLDHDTNGLLGI